MTLDFIVKNNSYPVGELIINRVALL